MNAIYKIAEFYAAILLCNIYYKVGILYGISNIQEGV